MLTGGTGGLPVLIVGAGPVGMTLACELLQRGVPVRLIDAERRHSAHSRATSVWPRLLELLNRIGATEELIERGHRIDRVSYYSAGSRLTSVRFDRMRSTPYPFGLTIPQSVTEEVLERRLTELGGTIERGVRLIALEHDAGAVQATLSTVDGSTEEARASWLVGADGAHSSTRTLLGIDFSGPQLDIGFAITDAAIADGPAENALAYCWTPRGGLALGPLGDRVFRIAVRVPDALQGEEPSREFFQRMLAERGPRGGGSLGELRFSTTFRVRVRTAASFRAGRCFLAGDAAHVVSPAGGQGMNSGLQDAVNLGWKLAGVITGQLAESVLDSYDPERRTATAAVTAATTRQTRWGGFQTRSRILARDLALRAGGASGLLQHAVAPLMTQLGSAYPISGTTETSASGSLQPGDRVPVVPAADGSAVAWPTVPHDRFSLLLWPGTRAGTGIGTAAALAGTGDRVREEAPDLRVILCSPERHPQLRTALGRRPVAALVRPDGHLQALLDPSRTEQLVSTYQASHR